MANRILLGAIVEREGRILLIRQTPRAPWELPGGELQQRQTDADAAMAEALETFGIIMSEPEERFIETIYLPDGDGQLIYNLYGATDWEGEPEIPIGMGAGWYAFNELDAISMQDEVRAAILVAYGLRDAPDADGRILQAMAGSSAIPEAQQPELGALPTLGKTSPWAPAPGGSEPGAEESPTGEVEAASTSQDEPLVSTPSDDSAFARPEESNPANEADIPEATPEDVEIVAEVLEVPEATEIKTSEPDESEPFRAEESRRSSLADIADSISRDERPQSTSEPIIGGNYGASPAPPPAGLSRRERGLDVLRTMGNAPDGAARLEQMRKIYPELADDVVDFAMGDVWSGPALTRRERSLMVVAMLSAMAGRSGPLASHMNGALNHGATPDELVEVLRMVSVYAGFPAALEAWKVMEATFETRDEFPSGRRQ